MSVLLVLFHLITSGFGVLPDLQQRAVHLFFTISMTFLLTPASKKKKGTSELPVYDIILAVAAAVCCGYIFFIYNKVLWKPLQWLSIWDHVFAILLVLLLLEASRRAVGMTFPVMATLFFIYAHWGYLFPGRWGHRGMTLDFIFQTFYHTTTGIWGTMVGMSATMLAMFGIFGAVLSATGGSQTFIKLGSALTGKSTGGSGKVALIASGLFGMVSGSAPANVVATGTFTIPMMKKSGYKNEWAAAISAVGASGGLIMPPIMGAGAFIMSQLIGVPYITIAKAAIPSAFLYYFSAFICVHYFSKKNGIAGSTVSGKVSIKETAVIFIPIALFLVFLILGYTVTIGAFYASLAGLATCLIIYAIEEKAFAQTAKRFGKLCAGTTLGGARSIVTLSGLLAGSQIVITLVNMSGFGVKLASLIVSIGRDQLFICLLLSMVVCIIMGMGLPVTAAYVLGAAVLIPALTTLEVPLLAAHLFVFYFATLGNITPPVCAAVYLSAGLADANWLRTGWLSCMMAIPAFIVPYTFAYDEAFLLNGPFTGILLALVTATCGVFFTALAVAGFSRRKLQMLWRVLLFLGGITMIIPNVKVSLMGLGVCCVAYLFSSVLPQRKSVSGV